MIKQRAASIDTRNAERNARKSCSTECLSLNDAEPRIIELVSGTSFRSYFVSEMSRGTARSFVPYSRKSPSFHLILHFPINQLRACVVVRLVLIRLGCAVGILLICCHCFRTCSSSSARIIDTLQSVNTKCHSPLE